MTADNKDINDIKEWFFRHLDSIQKRGGLSNDRS